MGEKPFVGMDFEDVRKRVKRIQKVDAPSPQLKENLTQSLMNQVGIANGEEAKTEIYKELNTTADIAKMKPGSPCDARFGRGKGNGKGGWGNGYDLICPECQSKCPRSSLKDSKWICDIHDVECEKKAR